MAATTRATARDRTNREQHVVTRRRLRLRYAATPTLQRMPQSAPCVRIGGKLLSLSRSRFPIHHPPGDEFSRTEPPPTAEPSRLRNHPNRAKHEIPIDHHRNPAGSCLGGFPTPDGIRKPSPSRTFRLRSRPARPGHSSARTAPPRLSLTRVGGRDLDQRTASRIAVALQCMRDVPSQLGGT